MRRELKYDFRVDLSDTRSAHGKILRLVGWGKKVLEVGCATGYLTRVLKERFWCSVDAVEIDPEAAARARPFCAQLLVGDVEELPLEAHFAPESYDVILLADVLEHLRDPWMILRRLRPLVKGKGYLVASIPNIAHAAVILELIEGRFRYRPRGLLDEAHLRFFTREGVQELFAGSGYLITYWDRVALPPALTEFGTDLSRFPEEVVRFLYEKNRDADTYQFIVKAVRAE